MPPTLGTTYNPASVMMGRPGGSNMRSAGPYLWAGAGSKPPMPGGSQMKSAGEQTGGAPAATTGNVLAPESIRATGTGPFDSAYRQNLATYAGGQFSRPGGLSFNPTDPSTFPGNPTGGGNAPVSGMPSTLLDMALGGKGFSYSSPQPAATSVQPGRFGDMQFWLDQFMRGGRGGRMGSIT